MEDVNYGLEYKFLTPVSASAESHSHHRRHGSGDWVPGPWGTCSVTCGPGLQTRSLTCRQVSGSGSTSVSPGLCPGNHSHVTSRECSLGACPEETRVADPGYPAYVSPPEWRRQPPGLSPRQTCTSLAERIFPYSMAPSSASKEMYHVYSPTSENTSVIIVKPDWVSQAWGPCSVSCGRGIKERQVRESLNKTLCWH